MRSLRPYTPWLVGAAVLVAIYLSEQELTTMTDQFTPDVLPPDPAGRRAAVRAALTNVGFTSKQADMLLGQGQLETANFTSHEFPLSLSIWNRHVGSGSYGDWNGHVCMLNDAGVWEVYDSDKAALAVDPRNAREHLRCFDSLEQCVRDMKGLLQLPIYADAWRALQAEDAAGYAAAIARGNGKTGFVGDPTAKKAANYTAGLMNEYRQLGIA
jgi:hypothetical protein